MCIIILYYLYCLGITDIRDINICHHTWNCLANQNKIFETTFEKICPFQYRRHLLKKRLQLRAASFFSVIYYLDK